MKPHKVKLLYRFYRRGGAQGLSVIFGRRADDADRARIGVIRTRVRVFDGVNLWFVGFPWPPSAGIAGSLLADEQNRSVRLGESREPMNHRRTIGRTVVQTPRAGKAQFGTLHAADGNR